MELMPNEPDRSRHYVGLTEAANRLGVSTETIRRFIRAGRLTRYQLGDRIVRIDVAELDALTRPAPMNGGHDAA